MFAPEDDDLSEGIYTKSVPHISFGLMLAMTTKDRASFQSYLSILY